MDTIAERQPVETLGRPARGRRARRDGGVPRAERPYLAAMAERLWPGAGAREAVGAPPHEMVFLAAPSGREPRFLLPPGRSGARALRAFSGNASRLNRLRTQLVGGVVALGLGGLLFRDRIRVVDSPEGISAEMTRILGTPVRIAVYGGHRRANRKPVLAAMDRRGRVLAFAKVGTTPLATELVKVEAAALDQLAGSAPSGVHVPKLISAGTWRGMALVVQEALPVRRRRSMDDDVLLTTVGGIARLHGLSTLPWGSSGHAVAVRQRIERTPESPALAVLRRMVDELAADPLPLPTGCWHGDFTPWNSAVSGSDVLVWDWERFATGVPVGFDLLHFDLQPQLARAQQPAEEHPRALLAGAPGRLAALGLTREQARRVAVAYLVEIASRYLADDQAGVGARVGDVAAWLVPVIAEAVPALAAERGA